MSGRRGLLLAWLACSAAGCAGIQSATDARGPQAAEIAWLWWLFLGVSVVVWIAVVVGAGLALFRRNRIVYEGHDEIDEPGKTRVIVILTAISGVILFVLLVASVHVGTVTTRRPTPEQRPITIEAIGRQWWWDFRYDNEPASRSFRTANEIRIPVGRPVIIKATSFDVIHSFWVPNLHGKIDMVPGRTNVIWFQADEPGVYRGQCAEFCGLQHAKMAFMVVAEPEEQYNAWVEAYTRPADDRPMGEARSPGEQVFLEAQCSLCHTVRGTGAWGQVGPDLTRIGSRRTLAAGTMPNTRGHMGGWILDPQHIKPGNFMPPTPLDPERLQALLDYLESLK
ncbi:cytochrome c oxidase subunit II [soil metagenome]